MRLNFKLIEGVREFDMLESTVVGRAGSRRAGCLCQNSGSAGASPSQFPDTLS